MTEPVENPAEVRRHELLADVAEQAAKRLIDRHGLAVDVAVDVGNDMADFLAEHWRGQSIYMTADMPFKNSKRDLDIFNRMRRGNAHQLASELGLSYVRIYQIYRRVLAQLRAQKQPGLFPADGPGLAGHEAPAHDPVAQPATDHAES